VADCNNFSKAIFGDKKIFPRRGCICSEAVKYKSHVMGFFVINYYILLMIAAALFLIFIPSFL
jgi:hypothetical protein